MFGVRNWLKFHHTYITVLTTVSQTPTLIMQISWCQHCCRKAGTTGFITFAELSVYIYISIVKVQYLLFSESKTIHNNTHSITVTVIVSIEAKLWWNADFLCTLIVMVSFKRYWNVSLNVNYINWEKSVLQQLLKIIIYYSYSQFKSN